MTGLLNPPQEAQVCRSMIQSVAKDLEEVERRLTHTPLDVNAYHAAFGQAAALRAALARLKAIYDRNFNV